MAGEQTATARRSVTVGGASIGGATESIPGEIQSAYQQTIPANSTNYAVSFPIDVSESQIQAVCASGACTLKTNSTGSPAQTITLIADKPLIWTTGEPAGGKVFTTDVVTIYVTCTASIVLKIGVAQDGTP